MKAKEPEALLTRNLIAETESLLAAQERALLADHQLCASDLAILNRLEKKGPRSVNQIAPKVGLTSGSMTTAVQRLKRRHLVTTGKDPKDARKVRVEITSEGQAALKALTAERAALFTPLMASLNPRESKVLVALLKKIRKASR
ncbi:winged helix DNA-binding protein [Roseibacillus persicicus]|uniref:HTH marR-type domain-containing protein n=1 Tax=Roseibacillus persicicus TaxID=454148 RepID=A0A918TD41_9BACT|nr:winged helix DNA-binding protein [Roseibacillus persicicus]GHC43087.1 hypothetical protein GCM10007100_05170 [Roseibacillus persicicus]